MSPKSGGRSGTPKPKIVSRLKNSRFCCNKTKDCTECCTKLFSALRSFLPVQNRHSRCSETTCPVVIGVKNSFRPGDFDTVRTIIAEILPLGNP
jgi:hypothetical protein